MSYSINMKGHTKSEAKRGLERHIDRENEEQATRVMDDTDSFIDPSQTRFNKQLIDHPDAMGEIRDTYKQVAKKRKEQQKRKLRADANVFMTATIQLSNDSLEAMGWDKSKKADEQDPQALERVTDVYTRLLKSAELQPERYGKILKASLHLDETSPHIDFVSNALDPERLDQTARDFLNGKGKNIKKGQKMREMQDHLADFAYLSEHEVTHFKLTRGDTAKDKKKDFKTARALESALKDQERRLKEMEAQLIERERLTLERERNADSRQLELDRIEKELRLKDQALLDKEEKYKSDLSAAKKWADGVKKWSEDESLRLKRVTESINRSLNEQVKNFTDKKVDDALKRVMLQNPKWYDDRIKERTAFELAEELKAESFKGVNITHKNVPQKSRGLER